MEPKGEQGYDISQGKKRDSGEYAAWLQDVDKYLEACDPDSLQFGPTYKTTTSDNTPLTLKSIYVDRNTVPMFGNKTMFILAYDQDGVLAGHRIAQFTVDPDPQRRFMLGTGGVATRSGGVASSIELAYFDMLQRIANRDGVSIQHQASNFNLTTDLEPLRAEVTQSEKALNKGFSQHMGFNSPDEHRAALEVQRRRLAEKEKEQQNWQRLWGPDGELGFRLEGRGKYIRDVEPDPSVQVGTEFNTIDEITLQRVVDDQSDRKLLVGVPTNETAIDPQSKQASGRKDLANNILPSIKSALS